MPHPTPPVAKRRPHELTLHGETRVDDFFWMRNREDPEVRAYLEAENAFTAAHMAPHAALEQSLYDEIVGRIQETDSSAPLKDGGWWYTTRTEEGKQYPIFCRRKGDLEAAEEIYLDPNTWENKYPFIGIGDMDVTTSGHRLAYMLDTTGFRVYTLYVKDLATGDLLPLTAERTTSVVWAEDEETLFFTVEDATTKRSHRLYRQRLDDGEPTLVYEETDERFSVSVRRTRSRAFLVLMISSHTTSEEHVLPADDPTGEFGLVAPRVADQEVYLAHHGDAFYLRTNDTGRNFRIVRAPVATPDREHWEEVVPHRADVMIEDIDLFRDHMVLSLRTGGLPRLDVIPFDGEPRSIGFPDPVYDAWIGPNPEFDAVEVRFGYVSLTRPPSVFAYEPRTGTRRLLKQVEVLGGYDPDAYVSTREFAVAPDGTRVPVSIVRHKDTPLDGKAPAWLDGYGSYGFPYSTVFTHARVNLLDRGFVCAVAHVRGGGELGKPWHDDGRMAKKENTFSDFIAVAEHLIGCGYTTPERLVIEGGSAGGLLMGAVTNLRPDLFGIVVTHVPFVDVITTMSDSDLPLTVGEYEEWGNPADADAYTMMRSYCPYTNLEPQVYPTMLVKTSFEDSQVMYWEPAKYVARLRRLKTDGNPLLLHVNMKGGHGGSSGRYDRIRELAFDQAFVLSELGIEA